MNLPVINLPEVGNIYRGRHIRTERKGSFGLKQGHSKPEQIRLLRQPSCCIRVQIESQHPTETQITINTVFKYIIDGVDLIRPHRCKYVVVKYRYSVYQPKGLLIKKLRGIEV